MITGDLGGNAFPTEGGSDSGLYPDPGMSLRDFMAAAALSYPVGEPGVSSASIARRAYEIADAMLTERASAIRTGGQKP